MTWKKPEFELTVFLEQLVKPYQCEKKQMFGFPVYFVNNNMFTGVFEDGIFLRLMPEDKAEILREYDEITPFTPLGRTMKEYVFVPESYFESPDFCDKWLGESYKFVSSLPIKEKKAKK